MTDKEFMKELKVIDDLKLGPEGANALCVAFAYERYLSEGGTYEKMKEYWIKQSKNIPEWLK